MQYTDNALNILTLKSYKGIGNAWLAKNIVGNENITTIINLINSKSKQQSVITESCFSAEKAKIKEKILTLQDSCDGVLALGDPNFPKYRGLVKESEQPVFLFYKGNIALLNTTNSNIAVIGLLTPDTEIEQREQNIVAQITKEKITVVSGLALGCDSIAHKQALLGGNTIAILPSPLNKILPTSNTLLADEIVHKGGLLVSEYYEEHKSAMELSGRYKERDRLQALFSDAIILISSYAKNSAEIRGILNQKLDSGARLAMEFARSYNIPRAIMYNHDTDAKNPMFDLNRELLNTDKSVIILTPNTLKSMLSNLHNSDSPAAQQDLF